MRCERPEEYRAVGHHASRIRGVQAVHYRCETIGSAGARDGEITVVLHHFPRDEGIDSDVQVGVTVIQDPCGGVRGRVGECPHTGEVEEGGDVC